jgi:hypothetical protein
MFPDVRLHFLYCLSLPQLWRSTSLPQKVWHSTLALRLVVVTLGMIQKALSLFMQFLAANLHSSCNFWLQICTMVALIFTYERVRTTLSFGL